MTATVFGARNVAHASLIALETAEAALMPRDDCHSRLFLGITALEEAVSYLSFPTKTGRTRLRLRLEDLFRVQSNAIDLGQWSDDSLVARGLTLSIFVAQTTLAGVSYQPEHALHEAQAIVRLAGRIS